MLQHSTVTGKEFLSGVTLIGLRMYSNYYYLGVGQRILGMKPA